MAEAVQKTSYYAKDKTICPLCETSFYREDVLTGRGRLIAGDLTIELRRKYEASQKYGEVYPLIYPVTVCPACFYAAYPEDFTIVPEKSIKILRERTDERLTSLNPIFDNLDFRNPRTLAEGAASYFLAIDCYDYFPKEFAPTIKCGISALRSAWIFTDMHKKEPNENYDYLSKVFYRKARFFYTLSLEREQNGKESISNVKHLGPDLDKNYGYDGVLYLTAYLEMEHGPRENREARLESLQNAKRIVARIFGMGKASKNKPAAILDNSRDLYDRIGNAISEMEQDDGS